MRTKTLLIATAALAVGIGSSLAQTYSQNIVGYYNVTVPANKFQLVAVQLTDASGTFQINTQLTNGVADSSSLLVWNGGGFDTYTFYAGAGWFDSGFNFTTVALPSGTSALLLNGDSVNPANITVVGTVPDVATVAIPTGFGYYSMGSPLATNIDNIIVGFPSQNNDIYLVWDAPSQSYINTYTYYLGAGWFDSGFNQVYPTPPVGGGFLYQNNGTATTWNYSYIP